VFQTRVEMVKMQIIFAGMLNNRQHKLTKIARECKHLLHMSGIVLQRVSMTMHHLRESSFKKLLTDILLKKGYSVTGNFSKKKLLNKIRKWISGE